MKIKGGIERRYRSGRATCHTSSGIADPLSMARRGSLKSRVAYPENHTTMQGRVQGKEMVMGRICLELISFPAAELPKSSMFTSSPTSVMT